MVLPENYEYLKYQTVQGDTWDMISLDFYNDEYRTDILIEANPDHIMTLKFNEGITLIIPIVEAEKPSTLPPWKR